jgi:polyribonucleotide nucleotidyltransferase
LNLEVAGHKDAVNMVEAGASEITEQEMLEAIFFGHEDVKTVSLSPFSSVNDFTRSTSASSRSAGINSCLTG